MKYSKFLVTGMALAIVGAAKAPISVLATEETIAETEKCEHVYTSELTTAPTCIDTGLETFTCGKCEDTYTEAVSATGHTEVKDAAVAATCTSPGKTEGSHCSVCNEILTEQTVTPVIPHRYTTTVTKATPKKNGAVTVQCGDCRAINTAESNTIYRPKTVKLSQSIVTYKGKAVKPSVTVKDKNGKKINKKNYKVTYSQNKYVGKAKVTVEFKGEFYKGKVTKTFTIRPKAPIITAFNTNSYSMNISWKPLTQFEDEYYTHVSGFQIQYATNKSLKGAKSVWVDNPQECDIIEDEAGKVVDIKIIGPLGETKLFGFTSDTKYYVRMRSYAELKINGKTKKIYSKWSKIQETATKKVEMWAGPYPLYTLFYDEKGYPYFYGKWGGSANMDAYNLSKTDACMDDITTIMNDLGYNRTQISWESVGTYNGMPVVRRYGSTW